MALSMLILSFPLKRFFELFYLSNSYKYQGSLPLINKPFNLKIKFMRIKLLLNYLLTMVLLCLMQTSYGQCTIQCPANIVTSNDLHKCGAVVSFATPTLTGACTGFTITTSKASGSFFPVGTTTVTATAKDLANHTSTCTFTVKVNDTEAPVISNLSASPNTLWPPNHKMNDVHINYTTSDNCPGDISCHLTVSSDEPVNSTGDGNTAPDWVVINNHLVSLRAERKGNGNGRVYTITVTCNDVHGNSSHKSTAVTVAHDQGKHNLDVAVQTNPSRNYFTLNVQSDVLEKVNVKVMDISGRVVESKANVSINQPFILGSNLRPGIYFAEIQQGNEIKQVKLIKQEN